jgi:hypothetical protein
MMQKHFQGSHLSNVAQAAANQMVIDGNVDPCLSDTFLSARFNKSRHGRILDDANLIAKL